MAGLRRLADILAPEEEVPAAPPSTTPYDSFRAGLDVTGGEFGRRATQSRLGSLAAGPLSYVGTGLRMLGQDRLAAPVEEAARGFQRRAGEAGVSTIQDVTEVGSPHEALRYGAGAVANALTSYAPGLAVGAITRNPKLGLATMFPIEAGETAMSEEAQGADPRAAFAASTGKGLVNTALESVPFLNIFGRGPLRAVGKNLGYPGRVAQHMGAEGLTEGVQEVAGIGTKTLLDPNRDTSGDVRDVRESVIQGAIGSAPMAGVAGAMPTQVGDGADTGGILDSFKHPVQKAREFAASMEGKTMPEILDALRNPNGEKKYSKMFTGIASAEEDLSEQDSYLIKAIGEKRFSQLSANVDVRQLAQEIDAYVRGEGRFGIANNPGMTPDMDPFRAVIAELVGEKGKPDWEKADALFEHYQSAVPKHERETLWEGGVGPEEGSSIVDETAPKASYHFKEAKTGLPFVGKPPPSAYKSLRDIGALKTDPNNRNSRTYGPQNMLEYALENGIEPEAELQRMREALSDYEPRMQRLRDQYKKTPPGKKRAAIEKEAKQLTMLRSTLNLDTGADEILSGLNIIRTEALPGDDVTASDRDIQQYARQKFKRADGPSTLNFWKDGRPLKLNASAILATELKRDAEAQSRLNAKGEDFLPYLKSMLDEGIRKVMNRGYTLNEAAVPNEQGKRDKLGLRADMPVWRQPGKNGKTITYGALVKASRKWFSQADAQLATGLPPQSELTQALAEDNAGMELTPAEMQDMLRDYATMGPDDTALAIEAADAEAAAYDKPILDLQADIAQLDAAVEEASALEREALIKQREKAKERLSSLRHGRGSYRNLVMELRGESFEEGLGAGAASTQEMTEGQENIERRTPQVRRVQEETGENLDALKRAPARVDKGPVPGNAPVQELKPSLEGIAEAAGMRGKPPKPVPPLVTPALPEALGPQAKEAPQQRPASDNQLAPALGSEWDRTPAAATVAAVTGKDFNRQNFFNAEKNLTKEQRDALKEEVWRLIGKQAEVKFRRAFDIGGAGAFFKDGTGRRILELAGDIGMAAAESTAHHEAMHSFVSLLTHPSAPIELRNGYASLVRAARGAAVQRKLKAELAKKHPAAWEQVKNDPEEAVAYMFQFWRAGVITNSDISPTARSFFERMLRFLRDLIGIVTHNEKALALMNSFDEGRFSDNNVSVAGSIIRDAKLRTLGERLERMTGPAWKMGEALFRSSTDRLRDTNIKAYRELADMYHKETDSEHGKLSFLQKRAIEHNKWSAKQKNVLKGASQEQLSKALLALQSREDSKDPIVKAVRDYLGEMFQYLKDAKVEETFIKYGEQKDKDGNVRWAKTIERVPLRQVSYNYFPRMWDYELINQNRDEFLALVKQHSGWSDTRINRLADDLVNEDQIPLGSEQAYSPYFQSASNIKLDFIKPSNAAAFAKFQNQDLVNILTRYTYQAVHRAEYTKQFGSRGQVIVQKLQEASEQGATPDQERMAENAVAALNGTLGHDMDRDTRSIMQTIMAYENVVLLPMVLVNNFMDVVGIAVRSHDMTQAWKAFQRGIGDIVRDLRGQPRTVQEEMAELLGLLDDNAEMANYGMAYDGVYIGGFAKRVNDKFFKWTGMQSWNRSMRTAGMLASTAFIRKHYQNVIEKNDPKGDSARYLEELGLDMKDIKFDRPGTKDAKLLVLDTQWAKRLKKPVDHPDVQAAANKVQQAIFRFVDGAAIRPNAAHRPIWGSDPRFMLIFHLKQFTYSFQQVFWKYVNKETDYGNVVPFAIMMSLIPFSVATSWSKAMLLGKGVDISLENFLATAAKNTAVLGTAGFGVDAIEDLNRNGVPGQSFIGPTGGHMLQAMQTLAGSPQDSWSKLVFRSLPGSPLAKAALQ